MKMNRKSQCNRLYQNNLVEEDQLQKCPSCRQRDPDVFLHEINVHLQIPVVHTYSNHHKKTPLKGGEGSTMSNLIGRPNNRR